MGQARTTKMKGTKMTKRTQSRMRRTRVRGSSFVQSITRSGSSRSTAAVATPSGRKRACPTVNRYTAATDTNVDRTGGGQSAADGGISSRVHSCIAVCTAQGSGGGFTRHPGHGNPGRGRHLVRVWHPVGNCQNTCQARPGSRRGQKILGSG